MVLNTVTAADRQLERQALPRLAGIEASRGIAALLVVLFHATVMINLPKYYAALPLDGFFQFGYAGVDFFFILSGFIILFIHFDDIGKKGALRTYALKRLIRIYPVYWVVCAIAVLAFLVMPFFGSDIPTAAWVIQSLLLIPQETKPLVAVGWTLSHEMFFYFLFSILVFRPLAGKLIMGGWFLGILILAICDIRLNYILAFVFNLRNLEFLLGMLIALACRSGRGLARANLGMCIGLICFFATGIFGVYADALESHYVYLSYAVCSGLIIFGLASSELSRSFSIPAWVILLGRSSYSIYLVHLLALSFFIKLLMKWDVRHSLALGVVLFILFATATAAGVLFHIAVEKPLLTGLRKFSHRQASVRAA